MSSQVHTKYIINTITGYVCVDNSHPHKSIFTTEDPEQATQLDSKMSAKQLAEGYRLENYDICELDEEVETYNNKYKNKQIG